MLQLHKTESGQEYAEFLHAPKKRYTDFGIFLCSITFSGIHFLINEYMATWCPNVVNILLMEELCLVAFPTHLSLEPLYCLCTWFNQCYSSLGTCFLCILLKGWGRSEVFCTFIYFCPWMVMKHFCISRKTLDKPKYLFILVKVLHLRMPLRVIWILSQLSKILINIHA